MTIRPILLAATAALALSVPLAFAQEPAAESKPAAATTKPAEQKADFLFVQSAKSVSFDRATSKITLHDVSPITLFFADRPTRVAGSMTTAAFIPFWSTGTDSFLSDPPNADLSILEGGTLRQVVVELQSPAISGDNLTYTVKVISGKMPASGKDVSVFIDVIGMPLTPISYAGVARRSYRRAVLR